MSDATHLDIFSGIGGFAIAAKQAGFRTVAFCESDARCRAFLEKRWGLPVEPDIRKLDGRKWAGVSLLTGGPPCQPASRAGKQGGSADDRWLWPEALRVLEEAKPDSVVFENPLGIGDVGLDGILSSMGRIGYEVQCFDIPACAVDSPQLRHRYWIIGFLDDTTSARRESGGRLPEQNGRKTDDASSAGQDGSQRDTGSVSGAETAISGAREPNGNIANRPLDAVEGELADTERKRREFRSEQSEDQPARNGRTGLAGDSQSDWQNSIWVPCADGKLRRAPDDSFMLVDGLHRSVLGALGNAIVPKVATQILRAVRQVIQ